MPSERILVVGAGIAGSVLAFWLAKYDFEVVVVERSKSEQTAGQGLEIEEPALQVVKAMGIHEELKKHKTEETGFELVDEKGKSWAKLPAGNGASFTGALELMRGDLTDVLYKAADESPNVTYHFETTLHSITQTKDKVIVDLQHRPGRSITTEKFDMVIAADGQRSRTRQLVMGSPEELKCFKAVGAHVAYFSIPREDRDLPYSKMCHFPGNRNLWLRPVSKTSPVTSAYFMCIRKEIPNLQEANASGDRTKQKAALVELFQGCGWEAPRVIEAMKDAQNFYSEELLQVHLPSWSKGRVVLCGDSAWAPTPFTGQGNQLAIIGGFVLAQELSRNRSPVAFEMYEKRFRSYVHKAQEVPLNGRAPRLLVPETKRGIWVLRRVFMVIAWMVKIASYLPNVLPSADKDPFDLEFEKEEMEALKKAQ